MDIAYRLDQLVSAAKYTGSLTDNSQIAYEAITWEDEREKPSWEDIQAAPDPSPSPLEQLKTIFTSLPVEQQAQFGALASAVFLFLSQNNPEAAKLVIQNADAPPGMEAVKQQMLDVFG